jgi:tyrosinase
MIFPKKEYISDFAAPEKSIIWDHFGHAGNRYNDYCVPDGPFAYQKIQFPKPHCLRRQWNQNRTIPVWEPPEWLTSLTQTSKTWGEFASLLGNTAHFKLHLSVGGFEGDMSIIYATNE